MATTCPNCGHKFILRRFRSSPRIRQVEDTDLTLISDSNGIITTELMLKCFKDWSKEKIHDVAAGMVRNGVWLRLPGKLGRYVKIREYLREPRGDAGRSPKKERMSLRLVDNRKDRMKK